VRQPMAGEIDPDDATCLQARVQMEETDDAGQA
jgi:hypothetical protein